MLSPKSATVWALDQFFLLLTVKSGDPSPTIVTICMSQSVCRTFGHPLRVRIVGLRRTPRFDPRILSILFAGTIIRRARTSPAKRANSRVQYPSSDPGTGDSQPRPADTANSTTGLRDVQRALAGDLGPPVHAPPEREYCVDTRPVAAFTEPISSRRSTDQFRHLPNLHSDGVSGIGRAAAAIGADTGVGRRALDAAPDHRRMPSEPRS